MVGCSMVMGSANHRLFRGSWISASRSARRPYPAAQAAVVGGFGHGVLDCLSRAVFRVVRLSWDSVQPSGAVMVGVVSGATRMAARGIALWLSLVSWVHRSEAPGAHSAVGSVSWAARCSSV